MTKRDFNNVNDMFSWSDVHSVYKTDKQIIFMYWFEEGQYSSQTTSSSFTLSIEDILDSESFVGFESLVNSLSKIKV